jgi:hypothetical protein
MSTLSERLNRDPKPWKPEPNDAVLGVVLDTQLRDGGYGEYLVITIETLDGEEIEVHAYHTALRNEVMGLDVRPGDQLGVRYLGEQKTAAGQKYHAYRVVYERAERRQPVSVAQPEPIGAPLLPDEEPFPTDEETF